MIQRKDERMEKETNETTITDIMQTLESTSLWRTSFSGWRVFPFRHKAICSR